jgi:hypothetical protein
MSYVKQDTETSFSSPISKADLETWYQANYPTVYIVYHPDDDKLYWKEIHTYVKATPNVWRPPHKILFNKGSDEFNPACFESVRSLAPTSDSPRISFTEQERLFSNLLKIRRMPKVWSAPTQARDFSDVRSAISGFVPPFAISAVRIYSLSDLNRDDCVLRNHCDTSGIRPERREQCWSDVARRRDYVFMLNQLLGIHLRRCGVRYNREFVRNYFPRENQTDLEFQTDWYNVRTRRRIPNRQTAKFYTYGRYSFWRHTAADISFRLIGQSWFLEIVPRYFFTSDGVTPWDSDKVGEYTTQIKSQETNQHVLNQVLFWSDVLSRGSTLSTGRDDIAILLDSKPVMIIEKWSVSGIAKFAIPYDPAIFEEPQESGQLGFMNWLDRSDEDADDD